MLVRDEPLPFFAQGAATDFSSSATLTTIVSCEGMGHVKGHAKFSAAPAADPILSFSMDGVNFDEANTIGADPGSTTLYKIDEPIRSWRFVKITLTAPAGAGNNVRCNFMLEPTEES